MFDCLIARLYLQAIVFGDSDQSSVHILCVGLDIHVCINVRFMWKFISSTVAMNEVPFQCIF